MTAFAAVLFMLAAVYAQVTAEHFVADPRRLWALRCLLLGIGAAVGWMCARIGTLEGIPFATLFFLGFGLVHVPAALVLFLKSRRGESPS